MRITRKVALHLIAFGLATAAEGALVYGHEQWVYRLGFASTVAGLVMLAMRWKRVR